MSISPAVAADLDRYQAYLGDAYLCSDQLSREDLETLTRRGTVVVGENQQRIWGIAAVEPSSPGEMRKPGQPYHATIRLVAIERRQRLTEEGVRLIRTALETALEIAQSQQRSTEFVFLCRKPKLEPLLKAANFTIAERIQFMRLSSLRARTPEPPRLPAGLRLATCRPEEIDALVALDAAAFPLRWQLDRQALVTLALSSHLHLLWDGEEPAGYVAVSTGAGEALLDRIAVAPHHQGRGMGRLLMRDALQTARHHGATSVLLNTQDHNWTAQALYRGFGFRNTGRRLPVYTFLFGDRSRSDVTCR